MVEKSKSKIEKPVATKKTSTKSKIENLITKPKSKTKTVVDEMQIKDEAVVELIPKFKEIVVEQAKEEGLADKHQKLIKELRGKLENGTISDGEAAELFNLLAS